MTGPCEQCGADLAAGEDHRVDQGQHDVTGTLAVQLPPLLTLMGMVSHGQ